MEEEVQYLGRLEVAIGRVAVWVDAKELEVVSGANRRLELRNEVWAPRLRPFERRQPLFEHGFVDDRLLAFVAGEANCRAACLAGHVE